MIYPPFVSLLVFLYILIMIPALSLIEKALASTKIGKVPFLRKAITTIIIVASTLLFFAVLSQLR